mmetsp:Transcript_1148/g.4727  ORF Transcript_1148/g.4727 Transcript_1148/m.4727 type:complete len:294 (-) Transcript_1148:103-984(-)
MARHLCRSTSYTFRPNWSMTCTWGKLSDARLALECAAGSFRPVRAHVRLAGRPPCSSVGGISAHKTLCARPPAARDCAPRRVSSAPSSHWVFGSTPRWSESRTTILPSAAFAESATRSPALRTRLCSLVFQSRVPVGPCATPPPRICGALSVPTRARPAPFCALAFRVVPLTSDRVSVFAWTPRRLLRCHTTTLCAMSTRSGTSKWRPGSVTVSSVGVPVIPYTGSVLSAMAPWSSGTASRSSSASTGKPASASSHSPSPSSPSSAPSSLSSSSPFFPEPASEPAANPRCATR